MLSYFRERLNLKIKLKNRRREKKPIGTPTIIFILLENPIDDGVFQTGFSIYHIVKILCWRRCAAQDESECI